ncbi:hypothetical protein C2E23DRAFT_720543 [Lenzites betulinus]|nr:hypothetical protein C2E23DRAFT_720543 [Lenzites betulinus]
MSGTERFPRPPASEGSRSPELSLSEVNSDLAPAFSLHSSPVGLAHGAAYETSMTFARLGSSKAKLGAPVGNGGPPVLPLSAGFNTRSAPPTSAADGDELLDLFSILGLDEDEKWGPFAGADDSGVAFPDADPQGPEPPSKGGRVTRKRGDTIRASDFAKMPASASFDGSSGSSLASAQRVPPRRARSGTVMQATSSGSGRRKHEGWPTIKMRTTEEPLRVDGDEADDELLLKDGDVVD